MQFWSPRGTYAPGQSPYEIFTNRISAIKSIVGAVKTKIANKYWDQFNKTVISALGKKLEEDERVRILNVYNDPPPDNIYPENLEEVSGQLVDYTVGKMLGKEIMMGRLPAPSTRTGIPSGVIPTGTLPDVTPGVTPTVAPTEEVMLPKMDKQKLLDYAMSGGKMDWASILKVMEERPSFLGEHSPLERAAIEGVMGRDVMGELETGIKRAGSILDYYKEPEKARITNELEFFREDYEGWVKWKKELIDFNVTTKQKEIDTYIGMYNRKEITRDELMKGIDCYVTPEKLTDFQKKYNMFIDICEKNNIPITADNIFKLFGAYVGEEPGTTGTTDKVTTTEINLVEKQFSNVKTNAQYDTALATVRQTDKNVIVPTKEEIFKGNYNKAKTAIMKTAIDVNTGGIREGDYKEGLSYIDVYKALFEDLETAIREYQLTTGQLLNNPFLSFEEYEKTDVKPRKILSSSTWGQQKSVFKDENSYITGETEKGIKGKEDEHGYIIGATYKNAEGKLLKYLGNNEWEEITSSEEGRTRGIK